MISKKNVIMPVTGMSCSNCALTIESGVRKLKGVTNANIDFAGEKLKRLKMLKLKSGSQISKDKGIY
jgi:copper chaperone CopZ